MVEEKNIHKHNRTAGIGWSEISAGETTTPWNLRMFIIYSRIERWAIAYS